MAAAPPLPEISVKHIPGCTEYKPPVLYFGWYLELEPLLKWAAENGIDTTKRYWPGPNKPVIEEPNSILAVTTPEAMKTLVEKAGTPHLKLELELGVRAGAHLLISISSNYRFLKDRKSITRCHINALDKYLKEHGIVVDSPAWHIDLKHFKWVQIYQ